MRLSMRVFGVTVSQAKQKGFTMIEMLIALSIFSMLSLIAYQLLTTTANVTQRLQLSNEQYRMNSRALDIIENDLRQVVARPIKVPGSQKHQAALVAGEPSSQEGLSALSTNYGDSDNQLVKQLISFSRGGYESLDTIGHESVVRVQYQIDELEQDHDGIMSNEEILTSQAPQVLTRKVWKVLDHNGDVEPLSQQLLKNITDVKFVFFDKSQKPYVKWPANDKKRLSSNAGSDKKQRNDAESDEDQVASDIYNEPEYQLPYTVEVTIYMGDDNGVTRVIALR